MGERPEMVVKNSLDECNLPSEYVDKIKHIHKEIQDSIESAITEGGGRITQCELKRDCHRSS